MATVESIFNVYYGNSLPLNQMEQCNHEKDSDCVNFVSRTRQNNGVSAIVNKVGSIKPFDAGLITVAGSGNSVMEACVQESAFYTGYHVFVLEPKREMSFEEKMYYCLCLRHNRYRFNYDSSEKSLNLHEVEAWA